MEKERKGNEGTKGEDELMGGANSGKGGAGENEEREGKKGDKGCGRAKE